MSVRFRTKDLEKLRRVFHEFAQTPETLILRVGVGADPETEPDYPDGTKVADVARWNEFGTKNIPPRPFMRQTIDQHVTKWTNDLKSNVLANPANAKAVLQDLGDAMVEDVQDTIIAFKDPKNADSTIRQKGKDNPLQRTGVLLDSITSWVGEDEE